MIANEAFRNTGMWKMSPTASASKISRFKAVPKFRGLRSNFGSQAQLNFNINNEYTGQSNTQNQLVRLSTLRFTAKVNQIDPPESEEEHYSLDSKDERKANSPERKDKNEQKRTSDAQNKQSFTIKPQNLQIKTSFSENKLPQPSQPIAHEGDPPVLNQGNPESVAGIAAAPEAPKNQNNNNNNELIKAQEIEAAAIDPVLHNGDSQEDDDQEESDSDDIQFP